LREGQSVILEESVWERNRNRMMSEGEEGYETQRQRVCIKGGNDEERRMKR
jgi:hypothetical protein